MRFSQMHVVLLLVAAQFQVQAANEWKDPDQEPPRRRAVNPPPPRAETPPRAEPQGTIPAPVLEGQLALQAVRVCDYQKTYSDKGSGGKIDGSFYFPVLPSGYAMIGAYAQGNYHKPSDCVMAVKPGNQESLALLQLPGKWERVWKDKGSGANKDGSIWQASPQSSEYVCLGHVAIEGYKQPNLSNYVCVHRCLVESIPATSPVWSTKGTGANQKTYVYKLHNSNSFYVRPDKIRPASLLDLKGDMSCAF